MNGASCKSNRFAPIVLALPSLPSAFRRSANLDSSILVKDWESCQHPGRKVGSEMTL